MILYTVQWNIVKDFSDDKKTYFRNFTDGSIIAEYKTDKGYEYYSCSEIQMEYHTLGEYCGCIKSDKPSMVRDHETEREKSITLNPNKYL